jgi:hypothetical protein
MNLNNRRCQAMNRSIEEIKARCSCILENERIISLIKSSSSPSAAYDMVFNVTGSASMAKAGRWLAVLRRDHPSEYTGFTISHANNGKAN